MKRLLPFAVLGLFLAGSASAQDRLLPFDPTVETLENGLQVILIPMSAEGLVSHWTLVRVGARDEIDDGRTGFAHFFEHMMFRGTEKFPAEVYNQKITSIGSNSNAFTSTDFTAYHNTLAVKDLGTLLELESDRFQNLSYSEEAFQTEAGAVYGEYRKNRASPFFTIYEAVRQEAFDTHTYGHTAMGFVEDIQQMPTGFSYSAEFFDRFYRPDNSILVIVGDIDVDETLEMVRRYYGGWKTGYQEPTVPQEPEQTAEKRIDVAYEGSTLPILWLSYKFPAYDPSSVSQVAARVLAELAFGQTSEVYRKLVLEDQSVVSLAGGPDATRDPGVFDLYSMVKDPAKVDSVLADLDAAMAKLKAEPPSEESVAAIRSRLRYGFLMALDTPESVAGSLAQQISLTGTLEGVETYYETLAKVTPADVQQAAEAYFDAKRRTVAVLRGKS
ncbi:MAG: pitrilysin family protein [Acidobacteriota bacterium]